jgi:hypothetical protein
MFAQINFESKKPSGYDLYVKSTLPVLQMMCVPRKERIAEINKMWDKLDPEDKAVWNQKAA